MRPQETKSKTENVIMPAEVKALHIEQVSVDISTENTGRNLHGYTVHQWYIAR